MMMTSGFVTTLLLLVLSSVPFTEGCAQFRHSSAPPPDVGQYRHKSDAELAAMTPSQRVDEFAAEQAFHKYDVLDEQFEAIHKFIIRDGTKALPRIIQIIDEYDPSTELGRANQKGERFDAMWMLLNDLDTSVVRLRALLEGRQAMDALARAIDRMRTAGYGKKDQHEWRSTVGLICHPRRLKR